MLALSYYLLKVIICSGILFGYYWVALRNKLFHQYNRFYLLASIVLSLTLPIIKINFWENTGSSELTVIKVLQAMSYSDVYLDNVTAANTTHNWGVAEWTGTAYALIAMLLLVVFLHTIFVIYRLLKKYPRQQIGNISFINTDAKSTPFSFLNYIFWNFNIDADSAAGKQIFKHEVAHVQEKHTYDKLFINLVLVVYWCNPVFWLMRRELNMIHEFIADKKAVEDSDTASFAAMILQAAYPQHRFQLTNNFFYSPIKRRLAMLLKNKNTKMNYWGRILVLPLALFVFAAFTFKAKQHNSYASFANGSSLAEEVPHNYNFQAVFDDTTRKNKKQNIKTTINNNTCLISADSVVFENIVRKEIEAASDIKTLVIVNGKEFDNKAYAKTRIVAKLVKGYGENNSEAIKKYGAKASKGVIEFYDAVIEEPLKIIKLKEAERRDDELALVVVDGKEAGNGIGTLSEIKKEDIASVNVLKGESAVAKYGDKGSDGVIEIRTKNSGMPEVLYVIDGVIRDKQFLNTMQPGNIERIDVLKDEKAINEYGEKGRNGVVLITTKKTEIRRDDVMMQGYPNNLKEEKLLAEIQLDDAGKRDLAVPQRDDKVFSQTEVPSSYGDGEDAWKKYLIKNLDASIPMKEGWKPGIYTITVQFIVKKDGSITDVTALNNAGSKTAAHCISLIQKAGKWNPAIQNGHKVNSYRKQPITFAIN